MQTVHYIMLVCAALAAGLPQASVSFPDAWQGPLRGVVAILVLLVAVFGAVSPPAMVVTKKDGDA